MEDGISNLISELTRVITELGDRRTGDSATQDNPGMLGKAFNKSESQKKSEENKDLALKIAEQNAEQSRQIEEEKGRKILQSVTPVNIMGIDKTALKQLKSVMTTDTSTNKVSVDGSDSSWGWIGGFLGILGTIGSAIMPMLGAGFMAVITGIGTAISTVVGILAGPVGLILLAIAGLSAFFVGFWEEWEESGDIGAAFESGMEKVFDWLIAFPATLVKDLIAWGMRKLGFEEEADALDENWDKILEFGKEIFMAPYRIIVGVFDSIWGGITQIWDGIKNIFAGIGAWLSGDTEEAGELFSEGFGDIFSGLWNYIWAIPNAILNWFMELFGFKSEDDPDINLGDMLWKTVNEIFDWFKLLFTSPEEAFKKIGDWFDKLFKDPVGAFKDIMPDWLVDFGVWVYDHTIGPIVELWNKILGDPEGSKDAFLDLMPDWLRDIAEWIWDRTIGPAVELWNKVFGHPDGAKAGFKSLFPEWLWNIMEWIYDHTIGPVVSLFTDLFDGKDTEETFRKYLPDWMVDTFLWIKTNVFGGITEFFGKLFEGDVEGALRSILPDWLVDGLMWVVDTVFGPITKFWSELFDGNIEDAFRAILPDWLVDFAKWVWESISPIFNWLGEAFDWLTGDGLSNYVKAEYPEVYEKIWGAKKREEARQKEAQKLAETTGNQAIMTGQDKSTAAHLQKKQEEFNAEVTKMREGSTDFLATVGHDNSLLTNLVDNSESRENFRGTQENLKRAIKSSKGKENVYAGSDVITGMLAQLREKGRLESRKGEELEITKHIRGWIGTDNFNARNWEDNEANRQLLAKVMSRRMYEDEYLDSSDDVKDEFDSDIVELSWMGVAADEWEGIWYKMRRQIYDSLHESQGLPLGPGARDWLPISITEFDDDRDTEIEFGDMLSPAGVATAKGMLKFWEDSGKSTTKPTYAGIMGQIFEQWGLTRDVLDTMQANYATKTGEVPSDKAEMLDDFIMRPGMRPVAFNKGDIILGIHEDNPRMSANNSTELINRVDQMVDTLRENKDIQAKMLQALVESGLMDKQGNTVVNSGGNSTVVNNTTVESDIMSFRDRVVGRINNSTTKY